MGVPYFESEYNNPESCKCVCVCVRGARLMTSDTLACMHSPL